MHRFFITFKDPLEGQVRLEGSVAHRIRRVLRISPGEEIELFDGSGLEYRVRLSDIGRDHVEGEVISMEEGKGEPEGQITLYQSVLKAEKFEWVLEKGTELGVSGFVPLLCHRSVPTKQERWSIIRYPRWSRIIVEAAEQSGRSRLPQLNPPTLFQEACQGIKGNNLSIIPWEREESSGLRDALEGTNEGKAIHIFIGPEGGFEEQEVAYARSMGVLPVSLGRRILRSETASIATISAVLYHLGELSKS